MRSPKSDAKAETSPPPEAAAVVAANRLSGVLLRTSDFGLRLRLAGGGFGADVGTMRTCFLPWAWSNYGMKALWNAFLSGPSKAVEPPVVPRPDDAAPLPRSAPEVEPAVAPPSAHAEGAGQPPVEPAPEVLPPPPSQGNVTLNRAGEVTSIHPVAAAMFGYTPLEVLGRNVELLIPGGLPGPMDLTAPPTNGAPDLRAIGRSKEGRSFPLRFVAHAPNLAGERPVTVILHRSHELEIRGDVAALVSGWQESEQELVAAQQAAQQAARAVQTELLAAQFENQRLRQVLSESAAMTAESAAGELAEAQAEAAVAQAQRQQLAVQLEQLQQDCAARQAQQADLESRLLMANEAIRSLELARAAQAATEADAAAAEESRAVPATQLAPALAAAEAQRAEVLAQVELQRAQANAATQALAAAESELAEHRRRLDDQTALLSQVRQATTELRGRVATLTGNLAELQAQLAASQEQVREGAELAQGLRMELNSARERAQRSQQEAKALSLATDEVLREMATARVALGTLQHERDGWKARGEEARAEAEASAAVASRWERECAPLAAQCRALEQQLAVFQQRETEWRQAAEAAETRFAEQGKALAASQQEQAGHAAELQRLVAEVQQQAQGRTRAEHEAKALSSTTTEVSRELAGARMVLGTLQRERDVWKARGEEALTQAETGAAVVARMEREGAAVVSRCQALEQELAEYRQRETEWRQATEATEVRFAEQAKALATSQQGQQRHATERQRLADELQQELQRRTRAENEAQASASTTAEISREVAAARVVLETLRQERDLWQAQSAQAQAGAHAALAKLAAAEDRQRQLEEVAGRVCANLRRTLELRTPGRAPLVSALQAALARPAEAGDT